MPPPFLPKINFGLGGGVDFHLESQYFIGLLHRRSFSLDQSEISLKFPAITGFNWSHRVFDGH